MPLHWTLEAANDLDHIADYPFEHTTGRTPELIRSVYDAPTSLLTFLNRGRHGKKDGTRELVLSQLPYVNVYAVRQDVIYVVRILHGAQQWP